MSGTVLEARTDRPATIGATVDVTADTASIAPVANGKAAAVRALALARALLAPDQAATAGAVIQAAEM